MRTFWQRIWNALKRPPAQLSLGAALIIGAVAGLMFWGGFVVTVEASSSMAFCSSCHEMGPVFAEYQQSSHFKNPSGVTADCAACHVPHHWTGKIARKVKAAFIEVPSKIAGTISTPEKFEAKRQEFAERVWREMKENDSRECRNCHNRDAMRLDKQRRAARTQHERAAQENLTCIECHQGIAHNLPQPKEETGTAPAQ